MRPDDQPPVAESRFDFGSVEQRWRANWRAAGTYRASDASEKPRFYVLTMFPYPSGEGLHVGHGRNYVFADVQARYRKMLGFEVLYPMGWDSFGLPAENYAIKTGVPPRESTHRSIANMKEQLGKLGCVYDWDRELSTCEPDYYRWTQWLFLKLFHNDLAYRKEQDVNWCPGCQTVLANEQVVNGLCERSDDTVERRRLEQWFLALTKYAEQLLAGLDELEHWPEHVRTMQRNWIGRSEGLQFELAIADAEGSISVYTTRPDTIFGVTFVVVAPEHPLVEQVGADDEAVQAFVRKAGQLTNVERQAEVHRTGVALGIDAINPINGEHVPVWVANYVLMDYGTGAIMGVPAHDDRDHEFADRYELAIRSVLEGGIGTTADSPMIESGEFSGMSGMTARRAVARWMEARGLGRWTVTFRVHDWLVSRQRYWGAPIPIIHCLRCGPVAVPEEDLPVLLPTEVAFDPTGRSPLLTDPTFLHVACPQCGEDARRDTDTLDTFVDSSWYFLRFCDPHSAEQAWAPQRSNAWMPVDQYMGGVEHAILHLLYARFITSAMFDLGLVSVREPFSRLFNQGAIYKDGARMSKSRGNVVTVDEIVDRYGSDVMRVFQLALGPPEQAAEWSDRGIEGSVRFLNRVWRLARGEIGVVVDRRPTAADEDIERELNQVIKKVTEDIEAFAYNTGVASLMQFVNSAYRWVQSDEGGARTTMDVVLDALLRLLAPIAPHSAAELWHLSGRKGIVQELAWPIHDASLAAPSTLTAVVQINGKVRARFEVEPTVDEATLRASALALDVVQRALNGNDPRRVVVIPPKLVNIVPQ